MNVALPPTLNLISLCTGGGGLELGIGLALPSAHSVVLVEREAFAVGHLVAAIEQGLMAEAAIWSDVRTFDGRPWRGIVDGLIGGIPCQPHSLAGKRLGEDDERDLWSAARRIIVQSRPWFVVIENVEGMLTSGGAQRVVGDLRRLGFTVEIGLFSASETGASHQRNRVFIVAVADDNRRIGDKGRGSGSARYGQPQFGPADVPVDVADAASSRRQGRQDASTDRSDEGGDRRRRSQSERNCGKLDNAISGRWPARRDDHGIDDRDIAGTTGQLAVVDAPIDGWREGQSEPELRSGRDSAAGASDAVADAGNRQLSIKGRRSEERDGPRSAGALLDDTADRGGRLHARQGQSGEREIDAGGPSDLTLFPPGPSDLDGWRRTLARSPQLEPAVRRMADGVAARLDLAGPHAARIERLRLLGNGVVPLEAAYAFRVLVSRLAASGSAGATRLVRMMDAA